MASVTKLSIIRLFELVIVCVLIGLHYHSFSLTIFKEMLTMSTIGGYLIILIGLFVATLMGTPVNRRVDLFFSVVGSILFIIVGALNIDYYQGVPNTTYHYHDIGLAKGSIAIIEGVFFLADAVFTFRGDA